MRSFRVELGPRSHPVHIGPGALDQLGELAVLSGLPPGRAALVTDVNVARLYLARAQAALTRAGFEPVELELPAGESTKSLAALERIYDRLLEAGFERHSALFALGGGVIGDLAGFAAATLLRGVPLVQVPTTVVAQVDSALGGKTGVNHRLGKNLLGAFYQPRAVVADVDLLQTLPEREFREGLAEVIKYGAIMDAPMLGDLEHDLEAILARKPACLEAMVERSLRHKASVIERDEREQDSRALLNFGHTVGHALETAGGYRHYLHGEAVAIGMVAATALSRLHAGLGAEDARRLVSLIAAAGLPVAIPPDWRSEAFVRALELDKKRVGGGVEFVLLDRLGHALKRRLEFGQILGGLG